jgi:hypothetical protein
MTLDGLTRDGTGGALRQTLALIEPPALIARADEVIE